MILIERVITENFHKVPKINYVRQVKMKYPSILCSGTFQLLNIIVDIYDVFI